MAETRFCVLASARTGSNWLCSALNGHPDAVCHNELFHRREMFFAEGSSHPEGASARFWFNARHVLPKAFLANLEAQAGDVQAFGFKLFPEHGWGKVRMICRATSWKVIFLTRRNRLAQFSSLKIAQATGRWSEQRSRAAERSEVLKVEFHFGEYSAYVQRIERADARVQEYLRDRDHLALIYENLSTAMDRAFAYLDLSTIGEQGDQGTTRKQNPDDLLSRFANPDDVVRALAERGEGYMLS